MILHTVVPYSEIFGSSPETPEAPAKTPRLTLIKSGFVETDEDDKIIDLFSTDPGDYLNFPAVQMMTDKPQK